MRVRLWASLPDAERRQDAPGVLIPASRCQAATARNTRCRVGASENGLCFPHYREADEATRARAAQLAAVEAR